MNDPYGPYRPVPPGPAEDGYDVEYEVVSPPLPTLPPGYDSSYGYGGGYGEGYGPADGYGYGGYGGYGWPGPGGSSQPPGPPHGRPGTVTAAAVLALVEGGLLAAGAVGWVAVLGARDDGGAAAGATPGVLAIIAVAALLVAGGLGLRRGTAARLLTVATWAELGLLAVLTLWAVTALSAGGSGAGAVGVLLAGLTLAAAPVVRLVLLRRPPAPAWLASAAPPVGPPVWSAMRGRWVAPRPSAVSPAVLATVGGAATALAVAALVVIPSSGTGGVPLLGDPYASGAEGSGGYAGYSPWGDRYYRDGRALPAPSSSSHLYDAGFDPLARDCADGDMIACDDLYWDTPVQDFYEWFGSSCAGRVDHETTGGCVALLGPEAD